MLMFVIRLTKGEQVSGICGRRANDLTQRRARLRVSPGRRRKKSPRTSGYRLTIGDALRSAAQPRKPRVPFAHSDGSLTLQSIHSELTPNSR